MKELFQKLKESIKKEEDTVLATIIASSGSIPRGIGAGCLSTIMGGFGDGLWW